MKMLLENWRQYLTEEENSVEDWLDDKLKAMVASDREPPKTKMGLFYSQLYNMESVRRAFFDTTTPSTRIPKELRSPYRRTRGKYKREALVKQYWGWARKVLQQHNGQRVEIVIAVIHLDGKAQPQMFHPRLSLGRESEEEFPLKGQQGTIKDVVVPGTFGRKGNWVMSIDWDKEALDSYTPLRERRHLGGPYVGDIVPEFGGPRQVGGRAINRDYIGIDII